MKPHDLDILSYVLDAKEAAAIEARRVAVHRSYRLAIAAMLFLGMATPVLGQKRPTARQAASVAWQATLAAPADQYVGAATCRSCHKPESTEYMKTAHASAGTLAGKPFVAGCEACHGPGKAHVDAMQGAAGDDAKIAAALKQHAIYGFHGSPDQNAAVCLTCHITSRNQAFFHQSAHLAHGVACETCHSAHLVTAAAPSPTPPATAQAAFYSVPRLPEETRWLNSSLLRRAQPDVCYTCHRAVQAQFALPVHHRVPEGLVKCTDCHNPHGSANPASLAQPAWQACLQCHIGQRGPFVYEHPAVKVVGCIACHSPHGSVNAMLLARRDLRTLCLQCHSGFHDQAQVPHSRLGFQTSGTCIRCHISIHGSNFDPTFLR